MDCPAATSVGGGWPAAQWPGRCMGRRAGPVVEAVESRGLSRGRAEVAQITSFENSSNSRGKGRWTCLRTTGVQLIDDQTCLENCRTSVARRTVAAVYTTCSLMNKTSARGRRRPGSPTKLISSPPSGCGIVAAAVGMSCQAVSPQVGGVRMGAGAANTAPARVAASLAGRRVSPGG